MIVTMTISYTHPPIDIGGSSLATGAKGPVFKIPLAYADLEICFFGFYVQHIWFIVIESDLVLACRSGSISARAFEVNGVVTLSKLCTYKCALANQAIYPFRVCKLVPKICCGEG